MPNWKRVILSGSNAHLNEITASSDISGSALSTLHGFGSITASKFGDKGSNYTGSFSGDGSNLIGVGSETVTITANESNDETLYITFVDGTSGTRALEADSGLSYNPSTNMISAEFAASASLAGRITDVSSSNNTLSASFQDRLGVSVEDGIAYADSSNRLRNNAHVTLIDSNNTSNAVLAIGGQGTTGNSRLHLHASGSSNYFIGGIGRAAIGAQYNLMVGDVAHVVDGDDNVMVGVRGPSEQRNNTSYATTLGSTVMQNAKQIHATEGIGFGAGKYMVSASENTIIGAQAGLNLDGGARVTQVGHPYYDINSFNTVPDGEVATYFRDRSRYNTFIGQYAGAYFDKTRTHTATIGAGASTATLFRSGSNNVIIGRLSKPGAGFTQFETVIGAQTIGHGPFTSTIGSGSLYVSSQGDGNVYAGTFTGSAVIVSGHISGSRVSASNIVGTNLISDSGSFSTRTQTLETTMTAEQTNIDNLEAKVGQSLNTSNSPLFAGLTINGNISASGDVIAQNYIVRSTVTTITSSFSSGSTIFGDDQQDTHKFTGSLLVTGSLNIVGDGIISGSKISASNIVGTNLISDSGSFSTRTQTLETTMTAEQTNIDNLQSDSGSFSTRITTDSGSFSTRVTNLKTDSGSFSTRVTNLKTDSGSFSTRITDATASINEISTSMSSRLASAEGGAITGIDTSAGSGLSGGTTSGTATLSVNFGDSTLRTAISGAFTESSSSLSTRVTNLKTNSGSFSTRVTLATASIASATASISSLVTRIGTEETNVDNLQTDSGSFSTRVTNLKTDSGSFSSRTQTLETTMTSEQTNIDNLEAKVGQSLNTSDSPVFSGLRVSGDIHAERYIVSSSISVITSSFSSGSTIFGDTIDDTHKFTGSLFVSGSNNKITGSLSVSGSVIGKTLVLGGGTFTSASLASGGGGIFSSINANNSKTQKNLQITGSVNISSSLTVKPTDSGSTAINTTNINAGFPTANRWQDNLEGSYFNNFDHNTNVSEILRFMAGIISHSIDTASPTANTKTYGSVTPSYTDGTHSSKDTILNGVLGSDYEDGRLSKAWTGSAFIDMSETGSYKLALNYLQHKGWVQSSDRGTNSDDVGTNPFHGSYASRIPSTITTQGTYATLTHTLSATAGGSSGVFSNSNHFGLGGLTSGGATEFKVRVMATQSFSDNYADTTPDENSTFTRNAVSTLTQDSFGTSNGLTLAKINSANPAVIPAAFQDGIFSSVAGALSGRQNHGGSTTSTNISASGYYAIHGVKAGISTGSGNFSFQDGASSTTRFYLYTGGITTDITDGAPTGAALGVTGSFIKTKNSCVSRSFSGAPYVASLQVNYTIAAECTKSFDPVYNSRNTARTPLRIYLSTEAAPSPMSTTLSTATVLIDSDGVATAVTSGLKRGVFDRTKTTQRSDGDIPNISDMCIVSASYSQSISAGGNATDITKIEGNLNEQRYSRTFGYQGRNWQGSNSTVTDPANAQRFVLNSGTFGQPASSGSLAVYTRTQGTDSTTISSTTEAFLGEDHRRRIDNGLLGNTQGVFTTDHFATVDRKTDLDTQHGFTTQVPCMPGSYDLQVKPGYLVDPGSDYRYWFPSGYNSSQTYKYYIRTFQTDGGTKSSMTVRLRNEGDGGGGTTLQNWNSTGAGYAVAILFESSTTAGNNTSFSTARLYDVADQSNNVIETGVSADNFKNPFTDDIDLYGSKDGSTSSGTYTVPLRNADGMFLDASDNQLHLIIRHKAASSSNPEPLTSIIVSFS